jgi:cell division protein FtsQ
VARLALSGRGSWEAEMDNGAVVEIGRGSDEEVLARCARFVRTVTQAAARRRAAGARPICGTPMAMRCA